MEFYLRSRFKVSHLNFPLYLLAKLASSEFCSSLAGNLLGMEFNMFHKNMHIYVRDIRSMQFHLSHIRFCMHCAQSRSFRFQWVIVVMRQRLSTRTMFCVAQQVTRSASSINLIGQSDNAKVFHFWSICVFLLRKNAAIVRPSTVLPFDLVWRRPLSIWSLRVHLKARAYCILAPLLTIRTLYGRSEMVGAGDRLGERGIWTFQEMVSRANVIIECMEYQNARSSSAVICICVNRSQSN